MNKLYEYNLFVWLFQNQFQYTDKEFYSKLKNALRALEDYVVLSENVEMIGEDQSEFYNKMQELITDIYDVLLQKHLNGKVNNH